MRSEIEIAEFESPVNKQQRIRATMSIGSAELNGGNRSMKELMHCADVAVYATKLNGRNQCCVYSDELLGVLNV